ncbi:NACHT domain-containing protein [Mycena venus]|uniref:NACHT domain-containing protein n=1 Tax=Mycena venus TaxID=2733690 RepID=A0A8H7DEZ4_9AGAR|nr:NACHT domain-containing protein [Mycena venus]
MPIFSFTSHVQITGGNFVDIGGDLNLECIQPPGSVDIEGVLTGMAFGMGEELGPHLLGEQSERARGPRMLPYHSGQGSGRQLVGAERTERGGAPRMLPYDLSHRRQILSQSDNSYSTSGAPPLPPFFSQYTHEQYPQLEAPLDDPITSSENPGEGMHPRDYSAMILPGSESEPLSGTHGFNRPQMQNSDLSKYHFLPQNLHSPALGYPLDWASYTTSSNAAVENQNDYHSHDLDANLSQLSPYPINPIDVAFPWNRPDHAPVTSISGGTFIGGNMNTNIQQHGEAGLHILHRAIAGDAFHDSAERYPQPRCHPETRTKLLDVLWNWTCGIEPPSKWTSEHHDNSASESYPNSGSSSEDDEEDHDIDPSRSSQDQNPSLGEVKQSSNILWLHGPAGSGKSAVAQSFCQKLQKEGRLGGSFFFKRGHHSRGNAQKLFPTIAYQLALLLPELKQSILRAIESDPAIVHRSFSTQLQKLIIEPCQNSPLSQPVPVIIDGLDECDGQDIQQEILQSIGNAVSQSHLPILFFIASRPESYIHETFAAALLNRVHRPLNIDQSFNDVRKYLLDEFGRIHREHRTMAAVPYPWPRSEIVEELIKKSSGYFVYVSTVIKFMDDKQFRPVDRLDIILGIKNNISVAPFDTLDQLYHQILCGVPMEFRSQLMEILAVISANFNLNVSAVEQLLELETGDGWLILRGLHSVIKMPDDEETFSKLEAYHASFLDFLNNPLRSAEFCVLSSQCRTNLTHHILKAFSYDDPLLQQPWHVAWVLGRSNVFQYITSADPSPYLLPHVDSLNPNFFFVSWGKHDVGNALLYWLKKFSSMPEGLIHLWEDYSFMGLCDEAWSGFESTDEQQSDICHDILTQTSPQLIRILYAYRALSTAGMPTLYWYLFRIHFCLGLSWEELRAAICPLRTLLDDDEARLREVLGAFTSDHPFSVTVDLNSLFLELATGSLCFTRAVMNCQMPSWFRWSATGWGFFLRSRPPSPDLLWEVGEIESAVRDHSHRIGGLQAEDLHNAVQWLKTFPRPPFELIDRYQHHLEASIDVERQKWGPGHQIMNDYTFDSLEKKWIDGLEGCKKYFELPTTSIS